jgi:ATP-dependent DNA helicase DinG
MASAVQHALGENYHLAVEAGTGVGKSFAYLIPAIDQVLRKKGRVLISTYTITLQQQLINKDVPFLSEILGGDFTAVLAKGRGNYLCKRRLKYALKKGRMLFNDISNELDRINGWSMVTTDGSLSDLEPAPSHGAWDAARSEHGNCRGRRCPHFRECFYWKARRQLDTADIIVANHAMLFSDLVLKFKGKGILPDYRCVIIDEAHNVEHVAEDHFGINLTNYTFTYLFNSLYNTRTRKGILAYNDNGNAVGLLKECRQAMKIFFAQIQAWYIHAKTETNGRCHKQFVDDNITDPIKNLRLELAKIAKDIEDEDDKFEFTRYIDKCRDLELQLEIFLDQPDDSSVYWVEVSDKRRLRIVLRSAPINVGPHVKQCLFDKYDSVITTSATLSCDGKDEKAGFEFFTSRVGLEEFKALKLGSPFDYKKLVTMYIEAELPEPNNPDFSAAAVESIKKYLLQTEGRAFILFTSYTMLRLMSEHLADWMADNDMDQLVQGGGVDRAVLLEDFKSDSRSVLFGTDSFWQGVDVPGDALSNVIIVRLPFAVPNHPLVQGRIEQMRAKGENPFFKFQLPTAIIKFKQGFGRLVRKKTDSGIVVVLDSRIAKKPYGSQFLRAIPKCKVEIVRHHEEPDYPEW